MCLGADRWEADGRGWHMGQAAASALTPEAADAERSWGKTSALGGQPVKAVPHLRGGTRELHRHSLIIWSLHRTGQ